MLYAALNERYRQISDPTREAIVGAKLALSYRELFGAAAELAAALHSCGVRKGHVVLVWMDNEPAFLVAVLAIAQLEAAYAPLEVSGTDSEARSVLELVETDFIVCGPSHRERATSLSRRVIIVDDWGHVVERHIGIESRASVDVDVGCIQLSSGTTGAAKGIVLDHAAFGLRSLYLVRALQLDVSDRTLCGLPLSHTHGLECLALPTLLAGGTLHLVAPRFAYPSYLLDELQKRRITFFSSVPQFYDAAVQLRHGTARDLSPLRHPFCGSAALSPQTARRFFETFGVRIRQGYGLAELSVICVNLDSDRPPDFESVGKVLDTIEWRLSGEGDRAELCVRSPAMFRGYLRDDQRTRERVRDGFLHTGDIVRVDQHGALRIVGRLENFVKVRGFKVHIEEVEAALAQCTGVAECALTSERDDTNSEYLAAHVVPVAGEPTSDAAWIARWRAELREKLSDYKLPREIRVRSSLPKTPLGKIRKQRLSEPAARTEAETNPR